jgi:hypothetical protein
MVLVVVCLLSWRHLGEREQYLWLFSGPGLLVLTLMAMRQRVHPNWPAVFLPAAIILTTAWAAGQWSPGRRLAGWRRAFRPGFHLAFALFLATYGAAIAFSLGWVPAPEFDPMRRLRGWHQLAAEVNAVYRALPDSDRALIITQSHRFTTSELAFYLPDQPRVYLYNHRPQVINSQHDLWETPAGHLGRNALIVVEGGPDHLADDLRQRFRTVRFLQEIDHTQTFRRGRRFALFHGLELRSWPERDSSQPVTSDE